MYILERCFVIIILLLTTYYNLKLGLIVCLILLVYLDTIHNQNNIEPFNNARSDDSHDSDCDVVKIPKVNINTYTLYTAIIVEPRIHKALSFVLKNFTDNLNEDWNFIIYHGTQNEKMVKSIIYTFSESVKSRITLVNLKVKNISVGGYSTMFFCPTFYDNIPTETFLIFQTDSIILKENKDKIYDFMKYDYVGAPWAKTLGIVLGKMEVGNGGLSLRKKSKMVELLQYKERGIVNGGLYGKYIAEDQFFCGYYVPEVNVYKPTFIKAMQFSIEAVFSEEPFGVHKLWNGLPDEQLNYLYNKYPDIKILMQLNK